MNLDIDDRYVHGILYQATPPKGSLPIDSTVELDLEGDERIEPIASQ